ncbi:hypothetical protein [Chamaesiphon sp. VAR_48_metabat_135_sub]|uniref:hypothetical protein n=1 Tax=Chamaesiphon sp. VAR_48_metabat_135_sub TaxID=2964699 RepID=UPI00286BAAC3|nr:hypothetical protein [Chamaesiphon sp. VAR_48_metabat_135_sub]
MLKIWLTWLQPRLGVFGTALVLSNPIYSYAAPKPVAISNSNKIPTQPSTWSSAKSTGTTLSPELLSGIPVTPDLAVRQLAINTMMTSGIKPAISATKIPLAGIKPTISATKPHQSNRKVLANLAAPAAKFKKLSKATKPQPVKHSVATALAQAISPQTPLPVPGLFIGNTDVKLSDRVLPNVKPMAQPMSAAPEIGAPTPLSAMMTAKTAVDPFPVVRPELMGKLQSAPVVASTAKNSAPHAINPIAVIPARRPQTVAPKQIGLKTEAPHSLDPIAAIPSGLQRLLGNNLNSQPMVAVAPIAKATTIANKPSLLALKQFISPTKATPTPVTMASLQLATAQAYTSVPKFDIPGEKILAVKPAVNLLGVGLGQQKSVTTKVVGRKTNSVALMNDRQLTPAVKQPWTAVTRSNNLGGLILGSQSLPTVTKFFGLLPTNRLATSTTVGLPARSLADFN